MHSDRIPESTKQWLQNEDFILWCLVPTQESEEWWVNYQKSIPKIKHPYRRPAKSYYLPG